MIIDTIVGARPNFMKVAALFAVAKEFPGLSLRLVHTGQHYDAVMSSVFLRELGLPPPVTQLNVGSATHAVQTAQVMTGYEAFIRENRPDMTLVVGDVNSTLGCALVAAKAGVRVAHVEAGLRSFDRSMPEEVNRVLIDAISDFMFATEPSAVANLAREGRPMDNIHLVGHVMIDTLKRMKPRADALQAHRRYGLERQRYVYMTLHRPSNVDVAERLGRICEEIIWLAKQVDVIFAVHPRTAVQLDRTGWCERLKAVKGLRLVDPVGYIESLSLLGNARMVVTDSGGLQEESSVLGVPCLTLRDTTERPITLDEGTNHLIADDWALFRDLCLRILRSDPPTTESQIPYWDGQSGRRILRILCNSAKVDPGPA
jgi:UDP-N-acetylglucosamine 2-epimerase (non-hydrolysing)